MQPDTTQARYELLTRHALAVAGVLASEIYLFDPVDRRPRRIAATHAPRSGEQRALEDFVTETRKLIESRLAGHAESSAQANYRLESVLALGEAAGLATDSLQATLKTAVTTLRTLLNADLAAIIVLD